MARLEGDLAVWLRHFRKHVQYGLHQGQEAYGAHHVPLGRARVCPNLCCFLFVGLLGGLFFFRNSQEPSAPVMPQLLLAGAPWNSIHVLQHWLHMTLVVATIFYSTRHRYDVSRIVLRDR